MLLSLEKCENVKKYVDMLDESILLGEIHLGCVIIKKNGVQSLGLSAEALASFTEYYAQSYISHNCQCKENEAA